MHSILSGTSHGTLPNAVGFAAGRVGQAFNLNGTSQYVDVPNSAALNPAAKVSVESLDLPASSRLTR